MQIIVYSKPNCDLCASFKDKLVTHLKVPFVERDLETALTQCETWREDGTVEVMVAHTMIAENVPLILIDGHAFNYTEALVEIKKRLAAGETAEAPERAPGDGKDMNTEFKEVTEEEFVVRLREVGNHLVERIHITSTATRRYGGNGAKLWKLEPEGRISAEFSVRDPFQKPMKHVTIAVVADDFKELLVRAELRVREEQKKGRL